MKKIIIAMLCIIFVIMLLPSCQNAIYLDTQIESTSNQILNLSIYEDGYGTEYWKEICKKFKGENPEIKINLNISTTIASSIKTQIASEEPPDFIYIPNNDPSNILSSLIENNGLLDISDVFVPELKEKIFPGFLSTQVNESEDKIYTAPFSYSTKGLWYNKNKFEQNNWNVPITWNDFFILGDLAKKTEQALFTYQGNMPEYLDCFIIPILACAVGENKMYDILNYVDDSWSSDKILQVIESIYKIGNDSYLLENIKAKNHFETQSEFLLGKSLFISGGAWMQEEMKNQKTEPNFEWGFTPPPVINKENQRYLLTDINSMYIPSNAKNAEIAKKFLAYQYSQDAILLRAKLTKTVPPIKGAALHLKPFVSQAYYQSYIIFEEGCKPYTNNFNDIKNTFTMAKPQTYYLISKLIHGDLSPKKFIRDMNELAYEFTIKNNG